MIFELGHFTHNLAGRFFFSKMLSQMSAGKWDVGLQCEGGCIFRSLIWYHGTHSLRMLDGIYNGADMPGEIFCAGRRHV